MAWLFSSFSNPTAVPILAPPFRDLSAEYRTVTTPIFEHRNSTALALNPQFVSLFKLFYSAVIKHLQEKGWLVK